MKKNERIIERVYKNPFGGKERKERSAVVTFKDDRNVLSDVDFPYVKPGCEVSVSVNEDGEILIELQANGKESEVESFARAEFYKISKDILSFKDFEILVSAMGFRASEEFQKDPYMIFREDRMPDGIVEQLSATPMDIAKVRPPKTAREFFSFLKVLFQYEIVQNEKEGSTGINCDRLDEIVLSDLRQNRIAMPRSIPRAKDFFGEEKNDKAGIIEVVDGVAFRRKVFEKEQYIENEIKKRLTQRNPIASSVKRISEDLTDDQNAVAASVFEENGTISVITGGPGTGKTRILREIISYAVKNCIQNGDRFQILAPTGKAAKRANEVFPADQQRQRGINSVSTIHQFFGIGTGGVDEGKRLVIDSMKLIIVDEASMLSVEMFYEILKETSESAIRLLLVGDVDQLPSVDAGNVLSDVIKMGVPTLCLTQNFRSVDEIENTAKKINNGALDVYKDWKKIDRPRKNDAPGVYFVDTEGLSESETISLVSDSACEDIYQRRPYNGIILTYLRINENKTSTNRINMVINDIKGGETDTNTGFTIGAPVIINRTNYRAPVPYINGTTGTYAGSCIGNLSIPFIEVEGDDGELYKVLMIPDEIDYAYALSIHKAQGSEYDTVYVVLPKYTKMITRKMLYTAITRAKQRVVVFSTKETIQKIVKNTRDNERTTYISAIYKGKEEKT